MNLFEPTIELYQRFREDRRPKKVKIVDRQLIACEDMKAGEIIYFVADDITKDIDELTPRLNEQNNVDKKLCLI